jgi:hypothetical protein
VIWDYKGHLLTRCPPGVAKGHHLPVDR